MPRPLSLAPRRGSRRRQAFLPRCLEQKGTRWGNGRSGGRRGWEALLCPSVTPQEWPALAKGGNRPRGGEGRGAGDGPWFARLLVS